MADKQECVSSHALKVVRVLVRAPSRRRSGAACGPTATCSAWTEPRGIRPSVMTSQAMSASQPFLLAEGFAHAR